MTYRIEYLLEGNWVALSDSYKGFSTAAMIATALENRGHETRIVEVE